MTRSFVIRMNSPDRVRFNKRKPGLPETESAILPCQFLPCRTPSAR